MQESLCGILGQDQEKLWRQVIQQAKQIREIRLRIGKPIMVRHEEGDFFLDEQGQFITDAKKAYQISGRELEDFFMRICQGSPYAFEDMLRQGFLTVSGGHRIGFAGQVVPGEDGRIRTIKHLYYVNIRIAHEILGVADSILPHLYRQGKLQNVLIISPPGRGKTTLLRELIRKVSDGNRYGRGLNVGVVDERSELAGAYLGCPQNDLGSRTDVLEGCPKAQGMFLLLRTMAPEVLAVDELGDSGDAEALRAAAVCGCRVMATVHGEDWKDVNRRFPELFTQGIFEQIVLPGEPKRGEEGKYAGDRGDSDYGRQYGAWTVVPCPLYCRDTREAVLGEDFGIVDE